MRPTAMHDRRRLLAGAAATGGLGLLWSATPLGVSAAPLSRWERDGEIYLGRATAPLVLLEYASFTCPHCAAFHREVLPGLKRTFIDTGRVRYVFRPLLTPPVEVAGALQVAADCAPPAARYRVIDALMAGQNEIMQATRNGTALDVVSRISVSVGGASSARIEACLAEEGRIQPILDIGDEATRLYGVTGTPSLVLNGVLVPTPMPAGYTLASVSAAIEAAERARRPRRRP
jgi:protein-disulfide isomerase